MIHIWATEDKQNPKTDPDMPWHGFENAHWKGCLLVWLY